MPSLRRHARSFTGIVGSFPLRGGGDPLQEQRRPGTEQRRQRRPILRLTDANLGVPLPARHQARLLPPSVGDGSDRVTWMFDARGRHVVRGQVAADDPPANPTGTHLAFDGPQRNVRSDVPGRPLADAPVLHALVLQVRFHLGAPFLAPLLLDGGIVVVGHGRSARRVYARPELAGPE